MGFRHFRFYSVLFFAGAAVAQSATSPPDDPAFAPLTAAYEALRSKDYDSAIAGFQEAIALAPNRPAIRQDLAYTLLKTGDTEAARDQFSEALRLDPGNDQVALEYAFLCYETKQPVIARRTFQRLAKSGNKTAQEAFENVDRPLREGIERWSQVVQQSPDNFSAREELARIAEQRDELPLASEQYEAARRLRPDRHDLLLDLGRIWKEMGREEEAMAALVAAWRGASARVSEQARELLPSRYPYLSEFERALALDPSNDQLRKDVEYIRGLGATVAAPALKSRPEGGGSPAERANPKELGIRSLDKGYMGDALKYLHLAHENDPEDDEVMLKLGWAYNIVKDDRYASHWFDLARQSPDPNISSEASRAYNNLAPGLRRFRTTVWAFPIFSTRWHDLFTYAQAKMEARLWAFPVRPYLSLRLTGDARGSVQTAFGPQYLSDRSVILAGGLATIPWRGITGWLEGARPYSSVKLRKIMRDMKPDLRGGVSYSKGFGHVLAVGSHGSFAETNDDGIFVSRFSNDSLLYSQNRFGYTLPATEGAGGFHFQMLWNVNLTVDAQRQYWANFAETGPGVRFRFESLAPSLSFSVNFLRGVYLVNEGNPRRPNYNELRVGIWYAFTH